MDARDQSVNPPHVLERATLPASPGLHTDSMAVVFAKPAPIPVSFAPLTDSVPPLPVHQGNPCPVEEKSEVV